jgi:hypothetical protein
MINFSNQLLSIIDLYLKAFLTSAKVYPCQVNIPIAHNIEKINESSRSQFQISLVNLRKLITQIDNLPKRETNVNYGTSNDHNDFDSREEYVISCT